MNTTLGTVGSMMFYCKRLSNAPVREAEACAEVEG